MNSPARLWDPIPTNMFARPVTSLEVLKSVPARNYFPGESVTTKLRDDIALGVVRNRREPIRSLTPPTPSSKTPYVKNGLFPNGTSVTRDRNVSAPAAPNYDAAAVSGISILGSASLAAPALLPVAAAAGIGYGTYKLGQALSLW